MDESGHSGDTGAAESGAGADARERVRVNGWATPDSPWSQNATEQGGAERASVERGSIDRGLIERGAAEDEVPSWRRPTGETRFPRSQIFPMSAQPASAVPAGEIPPSVEQAADRWPETRPRYSDLLAHLSPPGGEPARPPAPRTDSPGAVDPARPTTLRQYEVPTPTSAPPYPYEGDLDDVPQQRTAVPLVRPATPGGRRPEWAAADAESARHALTTTTQGIPRVEPASDEPSVARPSYDPSSFPRRVTYEPAPGPESSGYVQPAAYAGVNRGAGASDPRVAEPGTRVLPQRVPAQPDVPRVPEPPLVEPTAETPQLARIATHLRRGDVLPAQEREEGFDVQAILAAVREVDGVRDASLRSTPAGAHSLRLDLAEGADAAEVSRRVARLLSERMGLDAAMKGEAALDALRTEAPPVAPVSPSALVPAQARPVDEAPVTMPERRSRSEYRAESHRPPEERYSDEPASADVMEGAEPGPPRPLYPNEHPGPRIVIENVHVNTYGTDAEVEVRLAVGGRHASGSASGPAVDGYLLRLCAVATAGAVDQLLSTSEHPDGPARCFVEHAAAVPFGASQVAVVVLLLSCNGWVEQLAGSAVVTSDDRHAMVRATLAAVNRRLEALLSR